jgi:hypothetical protein
MLQKFNYYLEISSIGPAELIGNTTTANVKKTRSPDNLYKLSLK